MFVAIVRFPKISPEKEKDLLEWFEWTNNEFKKYEGFISRKLVKSKKEQTFAAVVELENEKVHSEIHASKFHKAALERLSQIIDGQPKREIFELVQK